MVDNTYLIKYEMEDGTVVDIGSLLIGEAPAGYTNLLPFAIDENGNDFVGVNVGGGDGFECGYRLNSSMQVTAASGVYVTGFIPITDRYAQIYVKNITEYSEQAYNRIVFYNSNFEALGTNYLLAENAALVYSNGVYKITPNAYTLTSYDDVKYVRFSCGSITKETVVTVNEMIK